MSDPDGDPAEHGTMPATTNGRDDLAELRKAAKRATAAEREVVDHILQHGCTCKDASIALGKNERYADTVLRRPRVRAYALMALAGQAPVMALMANGVVARLMTSAKSEAVQLKAADRVLKRFHGRGPGTVSGRDPGGTSVPVNIHLHLAPSAVETPGPARGVGSKTVEAVATSPPDAHTRGAVDLQE